MKANELMVGDYLIHNGLPYRVIQVEGIVRDGWMLENGEEDCGEPIPLTAEILEKNGFEKCAGNEWSVFKYEDDDYTKKALYQVLWSADELYLEIDSYTSRTGEFNRMGVEFVHELQHALRLCGITLNIEV